MTKLSRHRRTRSQLRFETLQSRLTMNADPALGALGDIDALANADSPANYELAAEVSVERIDGSEQQQAENSSEQHNSSGAICHGVSILAVTADQAFSIIAQDAPAESEDDVIVDGRIITAENYDAALRFDDDAVDQVFSSTDEPRASSGRHELGHTIGFLR